MHACTCTIGQVHLLVYYIKLKSHLSICLTVTPISQPCLHGLKTDLLEMKAESSGTTRYVFKSLHVRLLSHTSAQKLLKFMVSSVGNAIDF